MRLSADYKSLLKETNTMTQLHTLPKIVEKSAKRLGRGVGSGSGAKSGRGTTRHQTARTNIPLHFEGGQNTMTKKYPLLRGKARNKSVQVKPLIVNVDKLNSLKKGTLVTIKTLVNAKLVDASARRRGVKILARGKLNVSLKVDVPVSEKARVKIEQAGGTILRK